MTIELDEIALRHSDKMRDAGYEQCVSCETWFDRKCKEPNIFLITGLWVCSSCLNKEEKKDG